MKYLTRAVWLLSLVSLFNDIASELLTPVMPIYLKSIGYSVIVIGVIEGFAEATAGFSKGYFGQISDRMGKRALFVQLGYMMSAFAKPLVALFANAWWVFGARMVDRTGKGVRTGARDAMLSSASTVANKAKVFGFHRGIDTIGGVLGPAFAILWLTFYPEQYKELFMLALIPGVIAVGLTLLLKDKTVQPVIRPKTKFFDFIKYIRQAPENYRKLLLAMGLFFLFNSSDVFLLLYLKTQMHDDRLVIYMYIYYNLVYALFSFPAGILADKVGLKVVLFIGLFLFAVVYAVLPFSTSMTAFLILFFIYGLYAAITESVSKAWVTNIVSDGEVATATGAYAAVQSVCLLIASSIAGLIWYTAGPAATFSLTALAALFAAGLIMRIRYN